MFPRAPTRHKCKPQRPRAIRGGGGGLVVYSLLPELAGIQERDYVTLAHVWFVLTEIVGCIGIRAEKRLDPGDTLDQLVAPHRQGLRNTWLSCARLQQTQRKNTEVNSTFRDRSRIR